MSYVQVSLANCLFWGHLLTLHGERRGGSVQTKGGRNQAIVSRANSMGKRFCLVIKPVTIFNVVSLAGR